MNNQELLAKIEEWVEGHEYYIDSGEYSDYNSEFMVGTESLIAFIKKLLHE